MAFAAAYICVPLAKALAFRVGAIDQPDARKVHSRPMPRLGGAAIVAAFTLAVLLLVDLRPPYTGILLGGLLVFAVGALDDVLGLSPRVKLAGQLAAAAAAVAGGVNVSFISNPFDGIFYLGKLGVPLTMLWLVGITNAVNLIDGLDGLAAGVSGIAALTMGIIALDQGQAAVACLAFILAGAVAGFLPFNFHPARIFMGDAGALFLGFTLACLAVVGLAKSAALISLFIPIVILGIPVMDTLCAIVRRVNKKAPIFRPDRDHLHHRLLALGYSHRGSVLVIYGVSVFFGAVAIVLTRVSSPQATLILSLLLLLIVLGAGRVGMVNPRPGAARALSGRGGGPLRT